MPHNYSHTSDNPVVMVRLNAMPEDGWVYDYNTDKSYTGFYHLMQDGTAMIGEGTMGATHTINSNEIILQTNTDDDLFEDTDDDLFEDTDDDLFDKDTSGDVIYDPLDDPTEDDIDEDDFDDDANTVLTGTVAMISGDNRIWKMISYNNSGLFGYVEAGMTATLSDPSRSYFENKTIQELDLSAAMVTLTSGVVGAQHGDELNFTLDTSQQVPDDEEEPPIPLENPVVEVNLNAKLEDGWYFASTKMEYLLPDLNNPYVGLYHLMEDGTYMAGEGVLNASHEINPNEIIIQDFQSTTDSAGVEDDTEEEMPVVDYETIQEVREIVSDLFYKLWFESNTLTDEQVLSLQTTIRDGKKQTGRAESEPLVFYKKDRNTLENREDLQGEEFENICQDIFDNEIPNNDLPGGISSKFTIDEPPEESTISPEEYIEPNTYWNLKRYIMQYTNGPISYDIVIAEELIKYHDDLLPPDSDDTDTQESF